MKRFKKKCKEIKSTLKQNDCWCNMSVFFLRSLSFLMNENKTVLNYWFFSNSCFLAPPTGIKITKNSIKSKIFLRAYVECISIMKKEKMKHLNKKINKKNSHDAKIKRINMSVFFFQILIIPYECKNNCSKLLIFFKQLFPCPASLPHQQESRSLKIP